MSEDHYRVLGVARGASSEEIKRAYRRLARRFHPDMNPGSTHAETRFKSISEAYETLSDPAKRELYDRFGDRPSGFGGFGGAGGFRPPAGPTPGNGFAGGGLKDLFSELFKGGTSSRSGPSRGPDIQTSLELSFEQAVRGLTTSIPIHREIVCSDCAGAGGTGGGKSERCRGCGGTGQVRSGGLFRSENRPCTSCHGSGKVVTQSCVRCTGRGLTAVDETLTVKVPPGVDDGSRVRVPNRGHAGAGGLAPGDLYVITKVTPHRVLSREGDNLYLKVRLSVTEAALGATIKVPTLDGLATIKIPAGTTSGQRMRLAGKGVRSLRTGQAGDLILDLMLEVPRARDERARELLRELAELNPEDPRADLF